MIVVAAPDPIFVVPAALVASVEKTVPPPTLPPNVPFPEALTVSVRPVVSGLTVLLNDTVVPVKVVSAFTVTGSL